jgi:cyanophycinase-like exopeptidase
LRVISISSVLYFNASAPALAGGTLCLVGGGDPQEDWAQPIYEWVVDQSTTKKVVVVYLTDAFAFKTVSAFENAGITNEDQNIKLIHVDSFVGLKWGSSRNPRRPSGPMGPTRPESSRPMVSNAPKILGADILWFLDGSTQEYIDALDGTAAEAGVEMFFNNGGVVGGEGRAATLFGGTTQKEHNNPLLPKFALQDPYHPKMLLVSDFLELLPSTVMDHNFLIQGSIGRLPVMLGRANQDSGSDFLAIGVDDSTALCVTANGKARVRGAGSVTILHTTSDTEAEIVAGTTPHLTNLRQHQMIDGYEYDLWKRQISDIPATATDLAVPLAGDDLYLEPMTIFGHTAALGTEGAYYYDQFFTNSSGILMGEVSLTAGTDSLHNMAYATRAFVGSGGMATKVGSLLYTLAEHSQMTSMFVLSGSMVETESPATLNTSVWLSNTPTAIFAIDSHGATTAGWSDYVTAPEADGPRQSIALTRATLHVIGSDKSFNLLSEHCVDINGDGNITVVDVIMVLYAKADPDSWGSGDAEDLNGDGIVDDSDVDQCVECVLEALAEAGASN